MPSEKSQSPNGYQNRTDNLLYLYIDKQLDVLSCLNTRAELICDGHVRSMGTFAGCFWTLEQED